MVERLSPPLLLLAGVNGMSEAERLVHPGLAEAPSSLRLGTTAPHPAPPGDPVNGTKAAAIGQARAVAPAVGLRPAVAAVREDAPVAVTRPRSGDLAQARVASP